MSARPRSPRRAGAGAPIWWGVLALAGLAVGVVALESARTASLGDGPAARLVPRVPDWLLATVVALTALAALLLFAFIFQGRRRRRRKKGDEEEFQLYSEPPKVSPWAVVLMVGLALLPVALLVYALRVGWMPGLEWSGLGAGLRSHSPGSAAAPPAAQPPQPTRERPGVSAPGFDRVVGLLMLLVGVASLGVMLWIWLGDRLAWWWAGSVASQRVRLPLIEAIEESLDDLHHEPDARRAIILCYRHFERWLSGSGYPRAPWETPTEFMRRVLARLPIPRAATSTLTRLFERSRFSHHELGAVERESAVRSLLEIRAALAEARSDAPAA